MPVGVFAHCHLHPVDWLHRVLQQLGPQEIEIGGEQLGLHAVASYDGGLDHVVPERAHDQHDLEEHYHVRGPAIQLKIT